MPLILHYQDDTDPEVSLPVDVEQLVIGRAIAGGSSVDLSLKDPSVSRRHVLLYLRDGKWWARDEKSRFGTFYQGQRLTDDTFIPTGGAITIGNSVIRLEYEPVGLLSGQGVVANEMTLDPTHRTFVLSQSLRIPILVRIGQIEKQYTGAEALAQLIEAIREIFPDKAERITVLAYNDSEVLPIAQRPQARSYFSATLAMRAITTATALIWERTAGENAPSLDDVTTAMYVPVVNNRTPIGVLHVDSTQPHARFTAEDLELLCEIADCSRSLLARAQSRSLENVPTVFLSYSRRNTPKVVQVANDLRRQSISVWYDERLQPGKEWQKGLEVAIGAVQLFVLLMSKESLASENVAWEIEQAVAQNKAILPVLLEPCKVPPQFSKIQYVDLTGDYDRGRFMLVKGIRDLTGS
ncbi:MAG: TIR domain-containing protein [Anaerolineae bacterium]|nr:TIR domain-containing protein [Anaerolineae bacterium]